MTHEHETDHHDDPNSTDGGFWGIFAITLVSVIVLLLGWANTHGIISIILFILMITITVLFYIGAEELKPNQIGAYIRNGEFTDRYKSNGGFCFHWPFFEQLVKLDAGMFTLDIPYADLTMKNGDNAKGTIQLIVEINPQYFRILYKVTGGSMDLAVIKAKVTAKLNETVPAKLGIAVSVKGITSGIEFEEAIKDESKALATEVRKLIVTHENNGHTDCFGLELKGVEIPTPIITGEVYDVFKKTQAAIAASALSEAEANEYIKFIQTMVDDEKIQLGIAKTDALPREDYLRVKKEAKVAYAASKGKDVRYYDGLDKVNLNPIDK